MGKTLHEGITLDGWFYRKMSGERIDQKDLDVIAMLIESGGTTRVRILSLEPLGEQQQRIYWGYVRNRYGPEVEIEYSTEDIAYSEARKLWIKSRDEFSNLWNAAPFPNVCFSKH
jgi:hypothetical protein